MKIRELSLRNYRTFEEVDLELPARVIGVFEPNGAGKCLPAGTRVYDADAGEAVPIERLVAEKRKRTFGLRNGRIEPVDIVDWLELGPRATVRLNLKSGASLELAKTHPVLTDQGCVQAQHLKAGVWVAEARRLPNSGPNRLSQDEATLVGLLLGDGTTTTTVSLSAAQPAVIELFRECVERLFPGCAISGRGRRGKATTWNVISGLDPEERRQKVAALALRLVEFGVPLRHYLGTNLPRFLRGDSCMTYETFLEIEESYGLDLYEDRCSLYGGRVFLEWARQLDLLGHTAATKRVPPNLLFLPEPETRALLAGLWLTDGWIAPSRPEVAYATDFWQLASDVRLLLLRLGIISALRVSRRPRERPHYRVYVTNDGARKFGQIPLVGSKAERLQLVMELLSHRTAWPQTDLIPPSFSAALPCRSISGRYRSRKQLARHAMSRPIFKDFGGDATVAAAETAWTQVVSVVPTNRSVPCYDIEVDSEEHLYLAETLIVHNSSLVESVQFALYGRARTDKAQIRTQGLLTDCAVRLAFEHGGRQYAVVRTIRGKNHQTEAELYAGDRQLAAGVTEVDAEIQRLLRMDLQVFRASVFAEQKQLDAFSDVTKGKRKEMVLRLLGIRPVDQARTSARREARDIKQNAERLAGALPDLTVQQAELDAVRAEANRAQEAASSAEERLKEAEERAGRSGADFAAADRVREQVERIGVQRDSAREQLEELESQQRELERRIERSEQDLEALGELEKEHAALAGAGERLASGEKVVEAAAQVDRLQGEVEGLPPIDPASALAELELAQKARERAQRDLTKSEAAAERAGEDLAVARQALDRASEADPSQLCPTCGRPLGDDFEEYVAHCRKALSAATKKERQVAVAHGQASSVAKEAERRWKAATREGERARQAGEVRDRLSSELSESRKRLTRLVRPFDGQVPDLDALRLSAQRSAELQERLAELRADRKHAATARQDLLKVSAAIEKQRGRIMDLDRQSADLAFDPEDHGRLRKERDEAGRLLELARRQERQAASLLAEARQALSRLQGAIEQARETAARLGELRDEARYLERVSLLLDGFRDHLVARIGPELSREAEALFRDLTNREYEDLRIHEDTLAIEIADGTQYFPIERFSGSEADLANLALRVAISTHLSRVSGADLGMLVLDEVLGSLDLERKDLFVQTMGRLAGRFHQLFVITHAEQVKDQFPASIEVRKTGRRRSQAALV
jgi:DNA repair exonuclease SbcCD ATPase subunit/intein/homing endonuclease